MVIDTSAILAVFFAEKHAQWVVDHMKTNASNLCMSTVNLTETLLLLQARQSNDFKNLEKTLFSSGITFVSPDIEQAKIAAYARNKYPLNLGDCFVYALAASRDDTILTVDRDFKSVDCKLLLPPI